MYMGEDWNRVQTTLMKGMLSPLTSELNPSAQRCLTRFFTGDFASWTAHFVNICVKNQQMQQLLIQFINYLRMIAPACFGITLPSSGSVPSALWEMLNWGAVDRILWRGVLCLVTWCMQPLETGTPLPSKHPILHIFFNKHTYWIF
jgi:hypothetical protein